MPPVMAPYTEPEEHVCIMLQLVAAVKKSFGALQPHTSVSYGDCVCELATGRGIGRLPLGEGWASWGPR